MADYYEEREKRRTLLAKRKKRRRIRHIQQIIVILIGILLILFIVKGIKSVASIGSKLIFKEKVEKTVNRSEEDKTENAVIMKQEQVGEGSLILVNEEHPIRKVSEENLVELGSLQPEGYSIKDLSIRLNKEAATALDEMLKAFSKANENTAVIVTEGYRSFEEQEQLHYENLIANQQEADNEVYSEEESNAEEESITEENISEDVYKDSSLIAVDKPDRSDYQTGYTVTLGLNTGDEPESLPEEGVYDWFKENGAAYGFILRYDLGKENFTHHSGNTSQFRYVGKPHAELMKQKNICLEEYINYVQTLTYEKNPVEVTLQNGACYSVYYVDSQGAETSVPVPKDKTYTLSGDNDKGFVIAVLLSQ